MFQESFTGGVHPTTRLAAAALRRVVRGGERVLDVGAGDGSLAEIARQAGASEVVAIDRHPAAPGVLPIEAERFVPGARFDVVVANLPDDVLARLVPLLAAAAARTLIVTGARLWRGRALARAMSTLELDLPVALDGWCCLVGHVRPS
jgi:ribosomal protein L11 methyltransferase